MSPTGKNVKEVRVHPKNPEWRVVVVGEKEYIVFAASLADRLETGKPLPEGTTEEPPKFEGALPGLRLPGKRPGSPSTAYRNTERGQLYEQERMDRRTALMQAVALGVATGDEPLRLETILTVADGFYAWLRKTSGSAASPAKQDGPSPPSHADPDTISPPMGEQGTGGGTTDKGKIGTSSACPPHQRVTELKPDGSSLPAGKLRCEDCGAVFSEGALP